MRKFASHICFLFVAIFAAVCNAQTASEFFSLGNNAYKNGDYAKAKQYYESAAKASDGGAELYYNLANTNSKLGNRGDALLNYLRAIYENPRMAEARANLKMFAKDAALDIPQKSQIAEILSELSESEWTVIGFLAFWSAILLIFVPPLYAHNNMATVFLAITGTTIFIIAIVAIANWRDFRNTAVAIKPDVELRLSPTDTAPVASIVSEGQTAKIENSHGKFIYVITPNGKRGWVSPTDFAPVAE